MQLGRYTVEREIGRGGMGAVYRGRAPDGRPVAIKLLLRPGSRDAAARFDRERRLLAEIGHGFVPLLDAGATAQGPYLVMPFVGGGTLRDRIERGPMPLDEAVSLGTALATAMGRAHAQGVVHRDLKPENVLFTETGFPLIADLGLAKHFSDEGGGEKSVSLSKTGESIGTAGYMAPEQINDAKSAGPPADVFALGAILYEMLTGTPAFAGDTMHQRHAKVASGTFEPVRRARSEVPKWLARVVERSLAPRQGARYADGNELAAALVARDPGRRLWPFALGAGTVTGLVVVALVLNGPSTAVPRKAPPPPPPPAPIVAPPRAPRRTLMLAPELQKTKLARLVTLLGDPAWKTPGGDAGGVALLPGGGCIAAYGAELVIYDTNDGRVLRHFDPGLGALMSIDVAPDGASVLATTHAGVSAVVDLASERPRVLLRGQTRQIYSGRFFPDGQRAATASDDGTVCAWDTATGKQLWSRPTGGCAFVCAVSPDGTKVFSGGCRTWDDKSWEADPTPESQAPPGGREGFAIQIWDAATGAPAGTLVGPRKIVHGMSVSGDGTRVASGGYDCAVRVWDVGSGKLLRTLEGHRGPMRAVRFVGRSKLVTGTYGPDRSIRLWDLARKERGEEVATLAEVPENLTGFNDIAVSADGKRFVSQGSEGVRLWDFEAGKELSALVGHSRQVTGAALTKDGKVAVTASLDGTVRVWDVEHQTERVLNPGSGGVLALALSPDGSQALTAHEKGALLLWDVARGTSTPLDGHRGRVTA
ncbi:MAG TPA: protein kinase, partial [Planctomycetota bacterium]|nr:protein kinase [Planctomycetota bacterium]